MFKRARVVDNVDPEERGRIKVRVLGDLPINTVEELAWTEPLEIFPGGEDAGSYVIPDIDTFVFVLREENIYRNWVYFGSWNTQGDKPKEATAITKRVPYKSPTGHTIFADDTPGEENLQIIDRLGQSIEMTCPSKSGTGARGDAKQLSGDASGESKITLTDVGGNKIEMKTSGGSSTISVECSGNVTIQGEKVIFNNGLGNVLTSKTNSFCRYTGEPFGGQPNVKA